MRTSGTGKSRVIPLSLERVCEEVTRIAARIKGTLVFLIRRRHGNTTSRTQTPNCPQIRCRVVGDETSGFGVEIAGTIEADKPARHGQMEITLVDLTDGQERARAVYLRRPAGSAEAFRLTCDLGVFPYQQVTISDWLSVVSIEADSLLTARKGPRLLQLIAKIVCCETNADLAWCSCNLQFDNPDYGYLNLAEHTERTKALGVALALALSAADGKMYKCEIELVKSWAKKHLSSVKPSPQAAADLDRALKKTVNFFRKGNGIDVRRVCAELSDIAPTAQRYDILELCLKVAEAKGHVSSNELGMVRYIAEALQVNREKFRSMLERFAPANTHDVKDMELIFGLTDAMSKEQTRRHLNQEYRKWNARVTSLDTHIQNQAEQMLNLITEARGQYVT